ncbi:MAG: hypothetical protein OYH77_00755 [Pseudomonadota bacterium]|nr:hypothetical protein [Pseudomonadota bacterium]
MNDSISIRELFIATVIVLACFAPIVALVATTEFHRNQTKNECFAKDLAWNSITNTCVPNSKRR